MRVEKRDERVRIPLSGLELEAELQVPPGSRGLVLFAHGSGSSRWSPRNRYVAAVLRDRGAGTLLLDLLTADEERADALDAHLRFDIDLLARRLEGAAAWARETIGPDTPLGYFGASTGAAAALIAAADRASEIHAVVSRGGRPDLAADALPRVRAPTLLLVGGKDSVVLDLNRRALDALDVPKQLAVVPGATHLFEERGALEDVARLSAGWFAHYLPRSVRAA